MLPQEFWQSSGKKCILRVPSGLRGVTGIVSLLGFMTAARSCCRSGPFGEHALASLIINQASFAVQDAIAEVLAAELAPLGPEVIVGLPTLGLTLASAVARWLGHARYVSLGTSRKFWYKEDLSVPLSSITSPGHRKRLYVDPRTLPLLEGARVALVDDVISSGVSMGAGIDLMRFAESNPSSSAWPCFRPSAGKVA